jgi:hypothetical protein
MVEENVINVPDFVPGNDYTVELADGEQKPIAKARFKASVDGAAAKPVKSDDSGILKVKIGPSAQNITLLSLE